jgi:hypothetical protein
MWAITCKRGDVLGGIVITTAVIITTTAVIICIRNFCAAHAHT